MKLKQIYVSEEMARKLKYLSVEQGVTLQTLANEAIRNYLEDAAQNDKRIN